jgi:hypothetical protein
LAGGENMVKWRKGRPWRLIQTNLREIDMLDIDAEQYVKDMKDFKATISMINTSGIIASYPTELPFHFQSPFLKGASLQRIIEECHAADIKVFARTDFSKVRRPIYEAHPEWAYISPKGRIVDYNGDVHTCINGGYQQEYALKIIEETLKILDVDGIFFNMGGYQTRDYSGNYHGPCQCQNCRRRFDEMFGLPLPQKEVIEDPVYEKYMLFKKRTVQEHKEKVDKLIHKLRSDLLIDKAFDLGYGFVRQESNTAVDRPLPNWQYSGSDNTKWVVSSYPNFVSSNTTVDFIDFPYRHVAVSAYQQKLRLAQNLANGGALDYYLTGRLDNHQDRSGFEGIKEIFHYHAAHEDDYQELSPRSTIALINGAEGNDYEFRGWYRFLVESHYLFDSLIADVAVDRPWDKYDAVILPDYQILSDALVEKLDDFAFSGGTVISTCLSGIGDAEFERRETFPLKCLGIERIQTVRSDMRSSYFKLDSKKEFKRFPVTDLIYMDDEYVFAAYEPKVQQRLKLIPPHNYGPPERCYYETITDRPGFTVNAYGKGKGIYIPWKPGILYYRQGHTNTIDFIADLLENVAGLNPVGGNLSPMVEVTLMERADGSYQLLHLVNGSGHFGVTYFAPVTMKGLEVAVPYRGMPGSVSSLVTGNPCDFEAKDGTLTVRIENLELFEAIKIVK